VRCSPALVVLAAVLLGGAASVTASACQAAPTSFDRRGQVDGEAFEFSTSGTSLTDDHGSWTVRVRGDAMWIAHFESGKSHEFGTFQLGRDEATRLWDFVDKAKIARRPEGRDFGPIVASYSFTVLKPKKLSYTTNVSSKGAAADASLDDLVSYLQKLVRKYTATKAIIWPPDL
jgi:hypothetical protein